MLCFNQSNGVCNIVVWWTVFWRHPNVRAEVFFLFTKYPREALNSSPYRKRYGVYILSSTSAMFSAAIRAMLYAISWYDGPCFGGTRMYVPRFFWFTKYSREALHSSPHMKRYGVDIASSMSDISFVAIRAMLYSISWYDGPCFGGTRMYVPRFFDLQNIHERHSIALPTGRDMGCIIWVQRLLCFLLQSEQWCMQYRGMMGRVFGGTRVYVPRFFDLQNVHERHSIALPTGRDMGSILRVQCLLYVLLQSEQCCMQYRGMMDRVLAAPECTCRGFLIYKIFTRGTP